MSDNLCGPSNALKSFGEHVDRDRSLQQDRLTGAPQGGSSIFRGARHSNNDEAFQAFLQSPLPPAAGHGISAAHQPELAPHHLPYVRTLPRVNPRARPGVDTPMPSLNRPEDHELGPAGFNTWASEFAAGGTQNNGVGAAPGQMMNNMGPAQAASRPGMLAYGGGPMYAQMGPAAAYPAQFHQPTYQPFMNAQPGPAAAGLAPAPPQTTVASLPPGLTEEALAAQFAQLSTEYADFENEMDAYMVENGPTADERALARAETEDTQAVMERLADQLDQERAEGHPLLAPGALGATKEERDAILEERRVKDELSQTAREILDSVADNNSEKFANSSFLALMRRITAQEVVLMGDDLIDLETGRSVLDVESATPETDAKGKGKAVENGDSTQTPSTQ
ncbi:uncharacterized protein E0L32_001343 [Thyridium curvatum]|uniref:Peroxin 20 n=1 Tax=Thyridium curvatum TaxID=1093900 RepID=A0A507ATX0_9PEZI|nr:uncharacterized protein E0L32_001343 [Thyridium curvatum]TPX10146.1 hypothetical protein E0L32_001343 [Thyridium curvatum]